MSLKEVKVTNNSSLENTTIDLVYKYIDLKDPALKRANAVRKDYDNEELRYSLRSALKNIPWIRHIFIIMPNERVRFLKAPEEISEKITYIKDSDLLGFDSASSTTFEFNLWRLSDFNCSENIIYANDDCFFGRPLKKSDFFYEEVTGVKPYTLYRDAIGKNMRFFIEFQYLLASKLLKNCSPNSMQGFYYRVLHAHDITCKALPDKKLTFPKYPLNTLHNAIPLKLSEIKTCSRLAAKYCKNPEICLESRSNSILQPSFQNLYSFYFVNSANRKINRELTYTVASIQRCAKADFNYDLFCINTGADGGSQKAREQAQRVMRRLFPEPSKYELKA